MQLAEGRHTGTLSQADPGLPGLLHKFKYFQFKIPESSGASDLLAGNSCWRLSGPFE
jgi:hypothetical protein